MDVAYIIAVEAKRLFHLFSDARISEDEVGGDLEVSCGRAENTQN